MNAREGLLEVAKRLQELGEDGYACVCRNAAKATMASVVYDVAREVVQAFAVAQRVAYNNGVHSLALQVAVVRAFAEEVAAAAFLEARGEERAKSLPLHVEEP